MTENKITFFNSLKMKMSVILGVCQMVFGIILKATNDLHFKKPLDLWCEFVPQMIFMNGIFGYMCLIVIMKWNICWIPAAQTTFEGMDGSQIVYECTGKLQDADAPPDVKQLLIGMFMSWGTDMPEQQNIYTGMHYVQMPLVIICLICLVIQRVRKSW